MPDAAQVSALSRGDIPGADSHFPSRPGAFADILQSYRGPDPLFSPAGMARESGQVQVSGGRPEPYQPDRPHESYSVSGQPPESLNQLENSPAERAAPLQADAAAAGSAPAETSEAADDPAALAEEAEDSSGAAKMAEGERARNIQNEKSRAREALSRAGEELPPEAAVSVLAVAPDGNSLGESAALEAEGEEIALIGAGAAAAGIDAASVVDPSGNLPAAAITRKLPEGADAVSARKKSAEAAVAGETPLKDERIAGRTAAHDRTAPAGSDLETANAARTARAGKDGGATAVKEGVGDGAAEILAALEEGEGAEALATADGDASGGRDRRRVSIEVRDYRTAARAAADTAVGATKNGGAADTGGDSAGAGQERGGEAALSLDLRSRAASQAEAGQSAGERPNFRELLARELRGNLQGDIVRQASIVLRDGGSGVIRLTLHPESLGNVKIRLDLTENRITGQIVVESGEALRAFSQELGSLEAALRESGYEAASLEMSVADNGGQNGPGQGREDGAPWASGRLASSYDDSSSWDGGVASWTASVWDDAAVNVLV